MMLFKKLTIGKLKEIIKQEKLSDNIEICFEADIPGDYGSYGFYEYDLQELSNDIDDKKLVTKLVLKGGGEFPYIDDEEDLA